MHPVLTRYLPFVLCTIVAGACAEPFGNSSETNSAGGGTAASSTSSSGSGGSASPLPPEVSEALNLPNTPYDYAGQQLPAAFNNPAVQGKDNTPADNPIENHAARLGRVLFYDSNLSQNRTVACASCHKQEFGFSDDATLSLGFDGGTTGRNSMSLVNVRYYDNARMFWDERANSLEEQVLMPIVDSVEMGLTLAELVERVEDEAYYPYLFEQAFGDAQVSSDRISRALAQFVRSLVSYRSRFDEGLAQAGNVAQPFANFTAEENQGKALFLGPAGCGPCHLDNGGPGQNPPNQNNQVIFQLTRAVNNGLDVGPAEEDNGVGDAINNTNRNGDFKAPSLRNVAFTAPYMHDGRFDSLEEVVAFYNNGVQPHPNLDNRLRGPNGQPRQLGLNGQERAALVAFLRTLNDDAASSDPMYANPFRE